MIGGFIKDAWSYHFITRWFQSLKVGILAAAMPGGECGVIDLCMLISGKEQSNEITEFYSTKLKHRLIEPSVSHSKSSNLSDD